MLLCRVGTHDLCVRLRQRLHRQDRSTTDALPLDTLVCPCRATYPSDTSDTSDCSDLLRYLRSLTSNVPPISNLQVGVVLSERVVRHSRKKKVGRKFGGFGKMYYLCTRNSKERVFGGVWRALSGEQVLTTRELFVSLFVEASGPNGHYI